MFPCQRLLFSETKKKCEVKFCASIVETTVTYSKLQHQGNSGHVLHIKYSKQILVTRCKKKESREEKENNIKSNPEVIQIQTPLIVRYMKYQPVPEFGLLFSFRRPFAEIVTRGQQGSLQAPTHAEAALPAQRCALRLLQRSN